MTLKFPYSVRLACGLISIILISYILSTLQFIIVPVLFAFIFSILLYPVNLRFERWGCGKAMASFLTVIVATAIAGLILYLVGTRILSIVRDSESLADKFNELLDKIQSYISMKFGIDKSTLTTQVKQEVSNMKQGGSSPLVNIFTFTSTILIDVFLTPLYVFFFLYYRYFFLEFFYKAFKEQDKEVIDETHQKIYEVVRNWLLGVLLVMGIVGTLNSVVLMIIGLQNPFFYGFIASFLLVIPYVGVIIGSLLPATVALLTMTNPVNAIVIILAFKFIQIIESNFITPNIVGNKVSLNPLISILMLLMLGKIFGLSGLVLALPITAILKVIFDTVPSLKAYGFILGQPQHYHLKKYSFNYLARLRNLNKQETKNEEPVAKET